VRMVGARVSIRAGPEFESTRSGANGSLSGICCDARRLDGSRAIHPILTPTHPDMLSVKGTNRNRYFTLVTRREPT